MITITDRLAFLAILLALIASLSLCRGPATPREACERVVLAEKHRGAMTPEFQPKYNPHICRDEMEG